MSVPKKISQFRTAQAFGANDFVSGIENLTGDEFENVKIPYSVFANTFAEKSHNHDSLYLALTTWSQMFELVGLTTEIHT